MITMQQLRVRQKAERIELIKQAIRTSRTVTIAAERLEIDRPGMYRELREAGLTVAEIIHEEVA